MSPTEAILFVRTHIGAPTHTQELYHYGRKGMKWYKHIFGNFNLKAMGTGVGNLLDEDKVKEIARKLGIPLNQINQKMGVIREYFMRERRSQMTGNNPPAYDKTQRDAQEIKSVANAVRQQTEREFAERSKAEEKARLGRRDTYDHRFDPPEVRKKNSGTVPTQVFANKEEVHRYYEEEKARQEERERRQRSAQMRESADERHAEYVKKQRAEREWRKQHTSTEAEKEEQRRLEKLAERVRAKQEKEKRDNAYMEEQLAEQRRDEEEAYRQYKKRTRKDSGGGHRF